MMMLLHHVGKPMSASPAFFAVFCKGRVPGAMLFHSQLRPMLHALPLLPCVFLYKFLPAYILGTLCKYCSSS